MNNQILVTQLTEVPSELGEPDCKMTEPFLVNESGELTPWMLEYTIQNEFMISSDKILTIAEPNNKLLEKYKSLID